MSAALDAGREDVRGTLSESRKVGSTDEPTSRDAGHQGCLRDSERERTGGVSVSLQAARPGAGREEISTIPSESKQGGRREGCPSNRGAGRRESLKDSRRERTGGGLTHNNSSPDCPTLSARQFQGFQAGTDGRGTTALQ